VSTWGDELEVNLDLGRTVVVLCKRCAEEARRELPKPGARAGDPVSTFPVIVGETGHCATCGYGVRVVQSDEARDRAVYRQAYCREVQR
jgi:hypothetical protein